MQEIPNVSIIFKELTGISTQVDHIVRKNEAKGGYPTNPIQFNNEIQNLTNKFERKDKHAQLMNRFKNSLQQTKQLLGEPIASTTSSFYTYQPQTNVRPKYVLPQIRYRHLEKQKGSERISQKRSQKSPNKSLREEFYEEDDKLKKQIGIQWQEEQGNQKVNSQVNSPLNLASTVKSNFTRQSANENLLQKYYDICNKKTKVNHPQQNFGISKFERRQENELKIQKAMKLLLNS